MVARMKWIATVVCMSFTLGCGGEAEDTPQVVPATSIDVRSYRLGGIAVFAEMVGVGVKQLALSSPMEAEEMDALVEEAQRLADDQGVEIFRETDFLVTDLFSEELTAGKHVLLIYRGETLAEYQALKAEKERLVAAGEYDQEARQDVAVRFGRLLSYPDEKIRALLEEGDPSR